MIENPATATFNWAEFMHTWDTVNGTLSPLSFKEKVMRSFLHSIREFLEPPYPTILVVDRKPIDVYVSIYAPTDALFICEERYVIVHPDFVLTAYAMLKSRDTYPFSMC